MRLDLWRRPRRAAPLVAAALFSICGSFLPGGAVAALAVGRSTYNSGTSQPPTIEALRRDVARTSERLAAATTAWEQGQVQLGTVIQQKFLTERGVEALQQQTQQAQQRVSALASALCRNPISPTVTLVLSGDLNAFSDYRIVQRRLNQTSADVQQDIRLLTTQAASQQSLLQRQQTATEAAARLQRRLDTQLTQIQADAQASAARLVAAVAELRRRQNAAAANSSAAAGQATCNAAVPLDAINGFLPPEALCRLRTAPGQLLVAPAAQAFDAMSAAFAATFSQPLCVTDSYRDYATQVDVFRRKPNLAATPGRSQHGWGLAVDLCGGVQQYGSAAYQWLKQNSTTFRYVHPDWAEPNGTRPEPWHWEFRG
jgi:hypothetical protein